MLGIDPRAARAAWTVLLLALLVSIAYVIREVLVVFMVALLFAYLLMPLVGLVERITPKQVSPRLALVIVYVILVGITIALIITLGSRLVEEANSLAAKLPSLIANQAWIYRIPVPKWLDPIRDRLIQTLQAQFANEGKGILPYVAQVGGRLVSGAQYVFYMVLIPILAFFFLKDGREIRNNLVTGLADESQQPVVDNILEDINSLLGEYIRALVFLSIASFAAHSLFLGATGAPYAVLLAGAAGLGEFIPVIGPTVAGILIFIVSGLSGYNHLLLYVVFWIAFRLIQDYVVSPFFMARGVKLNPLMVLFGVLAGDKIAGVTGMFFSVPVIATLRVIFIRVRRARSVELVPPGRRS